MTPLTIPSPADGEWFIGPLPIRAYALCIIAGVIVAIWIGEKRWVARGGKPGQISDLAIWAIPFGLVGARLYHVATDWQLYFGEGRDPVTALYVWRGGLGIWGAIALGAVGAIIGAKVMGMKILPVLDALAPGVILAQAFGRWGNWFNQELFGEPTDLPWALEVSDRTAVDAGFDPGTTFHPTFLYESLWSIGIFALLIWADRRFRLGHGRVLALYVAGYTAGRGWIEYLRVDDVQLDDVYGLRFNVWVSIVLFLAAVAYFVWSSRRHPGREEHVLVASASDEADADEAEVDEADDAEADADEADKAGGANEDDEDDAEADEADDEAEADEAR